MVSSSSMARSDGSRWMSELFASAMNAFRLSVFNRLRAHYSAISRLHQRGNVGGGGIGEPFEIVTAFQHRDHAAVRARVGDIHDLAGGPVEIGLVQLQ